MTICQKKMPRASALAPQARYGGYGQKTVMITIYISRGSIYSVRYYSSLRDKHTFSPETHTVGSVATMILNKVYII